MKRTTTFLLSVLFAICLQAQNKHTISGYITDKASKETLIGATILDLKSGRGTITNEYGFYSITLPDALPICRGREFESRLPLQFMNY